MDYFKLVQFDYRICINYSFVYIQDEREYNLLIKKKACCLKQASPDGILYKINPFLEIMRYSTIE